MRSDRPLTLPMHVPAGPVHLDIQWASDLERSVQRGPQAAGELLYESPHPTTSGEPTLRLSGQADDLLFDFSGLARFRLRPRLVECLLLDEQRFAEAELRLLGQVISVWLELRGVTMLHASAAAIGGRAALFLATPHGGKSTLAADLAAAGHAVIGDDLIALCSSGDGWAAAPGLPVLKLWPDSAAHALGDAKALPRLFPGTDKLRVRLSSPRSFVSGPTPLAGLYLPDRSAQPSEAVSVAALPASDSLQLLLAHSFAARVSQALGLAEERLSRLAPLAERITVKRLRFHDGWQALAEARVAVENDLAEGVSAPGGAP